ncbi:MAG: two-component system response regulator [Anaerolinea sp.]|nr:two-component system response regulator [Anaerolinea sp.]
MNTMASASILLVEDNPIEVDLTIRAFARRMVTTTVVVARDGQEALDFFHRWDIGEPLPSVILLDLKLPKVDGLEVLRQLKTHVMYRVIPVVVLTSSQEDRDINAAYELGANSYIVKPVDFDRFSEIVALIDTYWSALNYAPARDDLIEVNNL